MQTREKMSFRLSLAHPCKSWKVCLRDWGSMLAYKRGGWRRNSWAPYPWKIVPRCRCEDQSDNTICIKHAVAKQTASKETAWDRIKAKRYLVYSENPNLNTWEKGRWTTFLLITSRNFRKVPTSLAFCSFETEIFVHRLVGEKQISWSIE